MDVSASNKFDLEPVEVEDASDYGGYEEVPVEDLVPVSDEEEGLQEALRKVEEADRTKRAGKEVITAPDLSLAHKPEVVDDFVRNFLFRMGMMKTLNCFQAEWFELQQRGSLKADLIKPVSDAHAQNMALESELSYWREEAARCQEAAQNARDKLVKIAKARDFHRRQHRQCLQEKNRLIADVKRLRKQCASHEPVLRQLKEKCDAILREKTLTRIEMDRTQAQVASLQAALQGIEAVVLEEADNEVVGETGQRQKKTAGTLKKSLTDTATATPHQPLPSPRTGAEFPPPRENPYARRQPQRRKLTVADGLHLDNTISAHDAGVSGLCLHPSKQLMVSTSDDHTWRMWSIPSGELVTTGEGHTEWLADGDFHPSGAQLATASGDGTVRLWDFAKGSCLAVLSEHAQAVWGVSWHWAGDFLASSAMDNLTRIWDVTTLKCRSVLRGHTDSVNSVTFLSYTNTLCTCSADKTVSLWDARTTLSTQTFYGHEHSVNHATPSLTGDIVASCDSYGVVRIFDVRTISSVFAINLGPHPANRLAMHPSGSLLAVASNDGTIKLVDLHSQKIIGLAGHDDAVQTVHFDHHGQHLVSGSTDCTVRVWS